MEDTADTVFIREGSLSEISGKQYTCVSDTFSNVGVVIGAKVISK